MSGFEEHAAAILQVAENIMRSGYTPTDSTFLIGIEGDLQVIVGSDWPLVSLQAEYGARWAYRLHCDGRHAVVEGREAGNCCKLEMRASE